MHLKAVLQLHLKDRPKDWLGITGETYVFGGDHEDRYLTLDALVAGVVRAAEPYFCMIYSADELNEQAERAEQLLHGVRFLEVGDER